MSSAAASDPKLTQLIESLLAGRRASLAKAITAVESDSALGRALLQRIRLDARDRLERCTVIGITGAPGCGKSTLTGALLSELRARDLRIGVIAVDPSSPLSGGALLGDRLRMSQHAGDAAIFVRSLSSRGRLGGLAPAAREIGEVMAAAGKDVVVIETVGTGQSEIAIASIADVKIVVSAPGLGDDIQAIKSGILEIADILVVNKGDLPAALQTAGQLRAMQSLRPEALQHVPVLLTSATEGQGIDALAEAILDLGKGARSGRTMAAVRRALIAEVAERLAARLEADAERLDRTYCAAILRGEVALESAAREIAERAGLLPEGSDRG